MADDIWVIDGDASGIEAAVTKAISAHSKLIDVEKQHIEVVKKLDKEGEAGYSASLKGLDKTGNQVIKTYNLVDNKLKETRAKVKETFSGEVDTSTSDKQLALLNARIATKRKLEAAKESARQKELAHAQKLAIAENKIFDKRRIEAAKSLEAQNRSQVRSEVRTQVVAATPVVKGANIAEQLGLVKAQNQLLDFVQKSRVSAEQINRVWGEVAGGNIKRYEGELAQVQQKIQAVQVAHGKLGTASQKAQAKASKSLALTNEKIAKQREALKGLNFSWQTMFRLIISQAASRAVGSLTSKIHESSAAALEFEQKLAAVQTIDKTHAPFQSWVASLRELSDSRGIDLIDQTQAAYQALSNQVGEGLQTVNLLREANDLALTGMASSTDTVNLLSSAINAFNIPVEDAKNVAASFFKTVELGRNTIPEMSNAFGRLALPAAQLGVTLNEVQAAIATTTINGVKFDVASTFLRNTLLALAKPSDDLSAFLGELGFNSGEAAIATLGLGGFLGELEKKAKGSSTEISSLFRNIRAISGATVFAGKGLEQYTSNLDAITTGLDTYDSKINLVTTNAGKQFEIASDTISNMFTVDNAVPFLLKIAEVTDGFKDLVTATAIAKDVLLVLGATALPLLIAGAAKATVAFTQLAVSFALLNPVAAVVALIAGSMATLALNTESASEQGQAAFEIWKRGFDELNAKSDSTLRAMERHSESYNKTAEQEVLKAFSKINAEFANTVELSKGASKAIEAAFTEAGKGAVDSLDQLAKASQTRLKELDKQIKSLDTAKIQDELINLSLDDVLGELNADDQLKTLQGFTDKLREARKEAAESGDLKTYQEATKQINNLLERQVVLRSKDNSTAADRFLTKQLEVNKATKQYGITSIEAIRLVGARATQTFSELSSQTDSLISKARSIENEILDLELADELFGKSDTEQVNILTRNIRELADARRDAADLGNIAAFNTANSQLNKLLQQRNKLNKGDTTDNSEEFARLQARKLAANALGDTQAASRIQTALNLLQRESSTPAPANDSLRYKREELDLTKQLARVTNVQATEAAKRQKALEQVEPQQQDSSGIKTEELILNKLLANTLEAQSKAEEKRFKILTDNKESLKGLYADLNALKISEFEGVKEINTAYATQYALIAKIKELQEATGTGSTAQLDAKVGRSEIEQSNANKQARFQEQQKAFTELSRQNKLNTAGAREALKETETTYRTLQTMLQDIQSKANTSPGAFFDAAKLDAGFADLTRSTPDIDVTVNRLESLWQALDNITQDGATRAELSLLSNSLDALQLADSGQGPLGNQLVTQIQDLRSVIANAEGTGGILTLETDLANERAEYERLLQVRDGLTQSLVDVTGAETFANHLDRAAASTKAMEDSVQNITDTLSQYTPQEIPAQYLQVAPTSVAPSGVDNTGSQNSVNFYLSSELGDNPSQVADKLKPSIVPLVERELRYRQTTRGN